MNKLMKKSKKDIKKGGTGLVSVNDLFISNISIEESERVFEISKRIKGGFTEVISYKRESIES